MENRPTAWIQSPAPNLDKSRSFYEKLAFRELETNPNFFWDGRLCVELNPEVSARSGIKISADSPTAKKFPENGLIYDPNGNRLYRDTQKGRKLPTIEEPFSVLGRFAIISIESHNPDEVKRWWRGLGFEEKATAKGWSYLDLGGGFKLDIIGTECRHLFPNPGITYFNGAKSKVIIGNLRRIDIPLTQELTIFSKNKEIEDAIIYDPGQTGFFIFSDENDYY